MNIIPYEDDPVWGEQVKYSMKYFLQPTPSGRPTGIVYEHFIYIYYKYCAYDSILEINLILINGNLIELCF